MNTTPATTEAQTLRALHRRGEPLVLVNAWDVASAQRVTAVGAPAIGTSSAAIAASLGLPDDRGMPIDHMFGAIARIAGAVDVPVTADLLDGYGLPPDVLVDRLTAAGAVGCNLEDSDHEHPGDLVPACIAAARIAAVRAAAARADVDLVINARIDTFRYRGPEATAEVVERARLVLDAGADCVYPVGLLDAVITKELVDALDAPVNANVTAAGGLSLADALAAQTAAGASRVSIGPMALHAALAAVDDMAAELLRR